MTTLPNKNEIKIETHHCYRCSEPFMNLKAHPNRMKTMHHAIPKSLNPDRNILVPICLKCHKEINGFHPQQKPKLKIEPWEGLIKNTEKFVERQRKMIEKVKQI